MSMIFGSEDDDEEDNENDGDGTAGESQPEELAAEAAEPVGGEMPLGSDDEDGGEGATRDIQDLETRLDDVEANVEQTGASVRSIEEKQDNLSGDVNELNDRIRQLLGVYDQATGDANPFADGDDGEQNGFGVIDDAPDDIDGGDDGDAGPQESEPDREPDHEETGDGVTEFEDLEAKWEWESTQDNGAADPGGEGPEPHENGDATDGPTPGGNGSVPSTFGDSQHLEEIPPTYAADIVVMQWLSELVRRSGQAGALKSFEYYESVGWISTSVRQYLETALSGPGIDAHVDPENPSEPTSVDHLESYTYIKQLEELKEVHGWGSA